MKKSIGIVMVFLFAVAFVLPAINKTAEAAIIWWQCTQCGKTVQHHDKAVPSARWPEPCKATDNGQHIWIKGR